MAGSDPTGFVFFLGGGDLEMETIAALLRARVAEQRIHDKNLPWGAVASAYAREIHDTSARGWTPVLIELRPDIALPANTILIDHHGDSAGASRPTSLEQVFHLLGCRPEEWTRWMALVAANDRGYTHEMASLGASEDEMKAVRAADRRAQGITLDEERAAAQSIRAADHVSKLGLTVIHLPHEKTAAAADQMDEFLGGPGFDNLLICSPSTVTFYGKGSMIERLRVAFPEGWWGGALPERGYWGGRYACKDVLATLASGTR